MAGSGQKRSQRKKPFQNVKLWPKPACSIHFFWDSLVVLPRPLLQSPLGPSSLTQKAVQDCGIRMCAYMCVHASWEMLGYAEFEERTSEVGLGLTFALHNRTVGILRNSSQLCLAWIMIAPLWRKCCMASDFLRPQRFLLRGPEISHFS